MVSSNLQQISIPGSRQADWDDAPAETVELPGHGDEGEVVAIQDVVEMVCSVPAGVEHYGGDLATIRLLCPAPE